MTKNIWTYIRIVTFYIIGIMNTVLIKPGHMDIWRHVLGNFFMALAVFERIVMVNKIIKQN
jgi:hypothetical protein